MALEEYVGSISLEVDGREIEVASVKPRTTTGRKAVKIMNRRRTISGFARGVTMHELDVTAVIPLRGTPVDWENIEGAKLTIDPGNGGQRVSYLDCFSLEVGQQYEVDNEARIDVKLQAVRRVTE